MYVCILEGGSQAKPTRANRRPRNDTTDKDKPTLLGKQPRVCYANVNVYLGIIIKDEDGRRCTVRQCSFLLLESRQIIYLIILPSPRDRPLSRTIPFTR